MKKSLLIAMMVLGVSFQVYATDHEDEMDSEHTEETMDEETSTEEGEGKQLAMSAKSAEAACKKEGKKGAALASCIKTKTSTH